MMVVPMTVKNLFGLVAGAWALLWLFSLYAISGVMGSSVPIVLVYLGMGLVLPVLLYVLFFRIVPWIVSYIKKKPSTHS
jgi:hypothetical protein